MYVGPAQGLDTRCECVDFDDDTDNDLFDYAEFQTVFNAN